MTNERAEAHRGGPVGMSPTRFARIAALAALAALVGDLMMLYVANAPREELGLPQPGPAWLGLGGVLGVVAIPLYALGYGSASRIVATASAGAGRVVVVAGAGGSLVGALIHGLTALHISQELASGAPARDPFASLVDSDSILLPLWGVAALLVVAASAPFAWFVGRGATAASRATALCNPVLVTVVVAVAGLSTLSSRAFLSPAAPNIAHLVFFLACSRVVLGGAPSGEEHRGEPG